MWFNLKQIVNKFKKLKTLGFCQGNIKRLRLIFAKMLAERKTMSVEGGLSGGGSIGAAPVSGLARMDSGPAFGAAPTVTGPVNEGPLSLAALKLTVPLEVRQFNPVGEVKFNSVPDLNVVDAIAEAESIIAQAQKPSIFLPVIPAKAGIYTNNLWIPDQVGDDKGKIGDDKSMEPTILPQVEPVVMPVYDNNLDDRTPYWHEPGEYRLIRSFTSTLLNPVVSPVAVQTGSQPKTESRVSAKITQAVSAQPAAKEQAVEEVVEEVDTKETAKTQDQEQIKRIRLGLVEDTPKIQTREAELNQAIELAAIEAKVLGVEGIEGWRIVNKLIPQHSGDRSETLNEEDPQNTILDGSLESVKEDIRIRKFTSLEEARKVTSLINRKYRPEKKGEENDITEEEHQRVHKDHKHPSRRPLQILERRIVRKEKQASLGQNTEPVMIQEAAISKQETSLEELNPALAEVFPKAASI